MNLKRIATKGQTERFRIDMGAVSNTVAVGMELHSHEYADNFFVFSFFFFKQKTAYEI